MEKSHLTPAEESVALDLAKEALCLAAKMAQAGKGVRQRAVELFLEQISAADKKALKEAGTGLLRRFLFG